PSSRARSRSWRRAAFPTMARSLPTSARWGNHAAGRTCFHRFLPSALLSRKSRGGPMRLSVLVAALIVAAPIGFQCGSALAIFEGQSVLGGRLHAYEGAWCLNSTVDPDRVTQDC